MVVLKVLRWVEWKVAGMVDLMADEMVDKMVALMAERMAGEKGD